jgi:hypothetical protein
MRNDRVSDWVVPDYGGRCFDVLPGTIERLLTGATASPSLHETSFPPLASTWERVVVVYLDAFGWELFERSARHRVFRRADAIVRLTSQFPSTTTAHVTTIHTGVPVGEHGVYEWVLYEPSLDRLIAPLLFSYAGDDERETLRGTGLAPQDVFPRSTLYQRLADAGVASHVAQSASFTPSSAGDALLAGAQVHAFDDVASGATRVAEVVAADAPVYAYLYIDVLDRLMHDEGPESANVGRLVGALLRTVEERLLDHVPERTLVLLVADHGMAPVSLARTAYLNLLWPELTGLVRSGADGKPLAPAGSPRDVFLHVGDHVDEVVAGLRMRLDGRARVVATSDLVDGGFFGPAVGDALRRRIGDVAVLPEYGEAVYWFERGRFEQRWRGMHGGLSPAEAYVPLVAFVA